MYSFAPRESKRAATANAVPDRGGEQVATAAATVQARLDATLNGSGRVASQQRLAAALNGGPQAVAQAKLMQLMSGPMPLPLASEGQGLTDEEELLQTKSAVQRQEMMDDEDLLQPKRTAGMAAVQRSDMMDDELMQTKSAVQRQAMTDDEDLLQPKMAAKPPQQQASMPRPPNTTGMPDSLKQGVESLSGLSLDHVRVHYNSSKPAQMQAHAYAQGGDIHLAPGQQQHLPHEAWHVVQQMQGRVPVLGEIGGQPLNDDPHLESEADRMGQAASSVNVDAVAQRCGDDRQK